jgi:hypothetical protein
MSRVRVEAVPVCDICGLPLEVMLPGDTEPTHVFCDICGKAEHPADMTPNWDGETGAHLRCGATY